MKNSRTLKAMAMLTAIACLTIVGCGANDDDRSGNLAVEVIDTIGSTVVENLVEATLASTETETVKADPVGEVKSDSGGICDVVDMVAVGDKIYSVYDGGIIIHDIKTDETTNIAVDERFSAVASHNGFVYAGGDNLYSVGDSSLTPIDGCFNGRITSLCSNGYYLLVGTGDGLYGKSLFGCDPLMPEIAVAAMAADGDGVWIGTDGDGLYRYDGRDFKKRFLRRDTAMFDYVTALGYHVGHLYVGTPNGLFDFDGGTWNTLSDIEGIPSSDIVAIDATSWVVYISTASGVVSFFDGEFKPVTHFEDKLVNVVRPIKSKLIVGTDDEGIFIKSGPTIRALVPSTMPADEQIVREAALTASSF